MEKPFSFGLAHKHQFCEFVYYEHAFLSHEVEKVRQLWKDNEAIKAELGGEELHKDSLRKTAVLGIENELAHEWIYHKLGQLAVQSNNERYWFDLLGFREALQLMHYGHGGLFDWHLDFGPGVSSERKLSLTVQLSDPEDYEGGDLEFRINEKVVKAPRTKGTVVVFPSFIMHRVTPVIRGERMSIVGWVGGNPFR